MRHTSPLLFLLCGKRMPNIDVYTGLILSKCEFTREHLIPKMFFKNKKQADHPYNTVPCHHYTNNRRSFYRFGDLGIINKDENILSSHKYHIIQVSKNMTAGLIHKSKKIFYPGQYADKGLIARNCITVLNDYPYLYDIIDRIVEDPIILEEWSLLPVSEYERELNSRFK